MTKKEFTDKARKKFHRGHIIDTVDGFEVIECSECGFKHIAPLFTDHELTEFYEQEFYGKERPNYFKNASLDKEWWILTYQNHLRIFENLCSGRKFLDIGSGPGYMLKTAQDKGWDVLGIEPSGDAAEYSRSLGVKVDKDFFTYEKAKKFGKFDAINLALVLEHVPEPIELLKQIKMMLKPDGVLCVISPNDYNHLQLVLREEHRYQPWWVVPKHHLNYFNFDSIKQLLKSVGFEIKDTFGTFPMEYFLLSGENYVGNDKVGRKCHARRKKFELSLLQADPELLTNMYRSLSERGIGREFVVYAKNK